MTGGLEIVLPFGDGRDDLLPQRRQVDPERPERLSGYSVIFLDQAKQDVLWTDVVVPELPCLFLSHDHDPAGTVGKSLNIPPTLPCGR